MYQNRTLCNLKPYSNLYKLILSFQSGGKVYFDSIFYFDKIICLVSINFSLTIKEY